MLTANNVQDIVLIVISIIIGLAIHEAMHAFVAHALGDTTARDEGRLTLNPLKHIDLITTVLLPIILLRIGLPPIFIAKPVPFNPDRVRFDEFGAAMVALAGPFTNLALAALASLLIRFSGSSNLEFLYVLGIFMQVNIAFFVFNMIPLPPLDGSRLLYALAPDWLRRLMERMESYGFLVTIVILLLLSRVLGPVLGNINEAIFRFLLH